MTLGDYLLAARDHRWEDGVHDCTTFPADWARTWGRGDPMAEWRGRYASEDEARALIDDAGGLTALFERGLSSIGATQTVEPREGDVGVILAVSMAQAVEHIGALWTGRRWAFRSPGGLAFSSAVCVRAWGRP